MVNRIVWASLASTLVLGCRPTYIETCAAGYVFNADRTACIPAADSGPQPDANADAPGLDAFEPSMPDSGADARVSPDATLCSPACSGATPVCVSAGVCGECTSAADCVGNPDGAVCNTTSHECVACVDSTTCTDEAPVCDTTTSACVGCLSPADCPGTVLDACVATVCVGCDDRADCMDDPGLPACVGNTCRQCDMNTDCPSTAARCDLGTNSCTSCTADTDCTRFGATPVCDEGRGVCVQCTGDTEAARCGVNSCRRSDGTCTMQRVGQLGACDSCEADSECTPGRRCVRHVFSGTDMGSFCFIDASMGGCGDTDSTRRPYRTRTPLTSIDGIAATYCMPPATTTCAGIRDTQSQPCATNTDCGDPRVADGYCPPTGTSAMVCTYPCGGGFDCRSTLNCGDSPAHCRP